MPDEANTAEVDADLIDDIWADDDVDVRMQVEAAESVESSDEGELETDEEVAERVISHLKANHANTLALLECLRACDVGEADARPYREVEAELDGQSAMQLCTQTPHVLLGILIDAGGIATVELESADDEEQDAAESPITHLPDVTDDSETAYTEAVEEEDLPVDYLVYTTEAGRMAMDAYDPNLRFAEIRAAEPDGYADVYEQMLTLCRGKGATLADLDDKLKDHPAMTDPKQTYPSYFISKLETVGGIVWDGVWQTTDVGEGLLADLATG
ncbi:MAG: hypothetical protein LUD25_01500 [Coriobacteriaceae bacterium]|nr:hypothetical protein [Coriobacteriaceae bacterium]